MGLVSSPPCLTVTQRGWSASQAPPNRILYIHPYPAAYYMHQVELPHSDEGHTFHPLNSHRQQKARGRTQRTPREPPVCEVLQLFTVTQDTKTQATLKRCMSPPLRPNQHLLFSPQISRTSS